MVIVSPLSRVIPLTNGLFMAYKWGLLTTYKSWDDPPSKKEGTIHRLSEDMKTSVLDAGKNPCEQWKKGPWVV